MTGPELAEERIAEATARAEKVACRPGDDRCLAFPDPVAEARASCTPKGRCRIGGTRGVILARSGRESWDVWLDVQTGEERPRRRMA
jgi:hypothetical protein